MTAGERVRDRITKELQMAGGELDGREEEFLDQAVSAADTIEQLEGLLETQDLTATTKGGGLVVNPLLVEVRLQRVALLRFLNQIEIAPSTASGSARKLANQRWRGGR